MAENADESLHFNFGVYKTTVSLQSVLPNIEIIACLLNSDQRRFLFICDNNTRRFAETIKGKDEIPVCEIKNGESFKNWQSVETIFKSAGNAGLGRDGVFIGVGGGVVTDISAFAASMYMRGCSLVLVPTTLLGMVDASLGGKTGINLFGKKNLAGTFYPARYVFAPQECLASLSLSEWKSGMAELIKTAILAGDGFLNELAAITASFTVSPALVGCIGRALTIKGGIVEEDPLETGKRRMILNLGHTFGHALESAAGPGNITHGEAVAWGIARSCDLGMVLDICPPQRAERIQTLLASLGYETRAPHPLIGNINTFMQILNSDKKKRNGALNFIVPDAQSARLVTLTSDDIVRKIIKGETEK